MKVDSVTKGEYLQLIEIWESSVRATHDFLSDENISSLKPLILEHYFDAVELRAAKNNHNKIVGFIGGAECNVEMLFISPDSRNKGVGSLLVKYAVEIYLPVKSM